MLAGNHERLTPLLARLRDCPAGRCWAWPDDTTPNAVPLEPITRWLWPSAGITADRAQHWLEPYAQHLESGQRHSRTSLEARPWAAAKPARPHKAVQGGGGDRSCHAWTLHHALKHGTHFGCHCIPAGAQFGQLLPKMTMSSWKMPQRTVTVPQASSAATTVSSTSLAHDTVPVPLASTVYATATVPQALSVNATAMVPQAPSVSAATTVLEASSAYNTAPVPLASSVSATAMVPQASSVNAGATVPPASSATTSTSMDVDAPHTSVDDMTEAEEWAMAEIYA